MRRVLRIAMWTCFGLAGLSAIALVPIHFADRGLVLGLLAPPFFVVLGLNAFLWSFFEAWGLRKDGHGVLAIAGVFVALAVASVFAVALLLFGEILLYSAIAGVG